jgi:translation elongation factor EF-1beta
MHSHSHMPITTKVVSSNKSVKSETLCNKIIAFITQRVHWNRKNEEDIFLILTYALSLSYAYHHESCEFESCSWRGVLDTTLCDKVCHWLVTGRWFSPGTPASSTTKTGRHDIAEILLKVALKHQISINQEWTKSLFEPFRPENRILKYDCSKRTGHMSISDCV